MHATQILMDEHRLIERVLSALQVAGRRVSRGEETQPSFFVNAALFIKNFADGCHQRKEEGVLFIAMNESCLPAQDGPVSVMLAEHEQGRLFTRAMKNAAHKWQAGGLSARAAMVRNALGFVALLRQHIQKENNVLFPFADRIIPPGRQAKIDSNFERILQEDTVAGLHEKYLALAEALEKESTKHS